MARSQKATGCRARSENFMVVAAGAPAVDRGHKQEMDAREPLDAYLGFVAPRGASNGRCSVIGRVIRMSWK